MHLWNPLGFPSFWYVEEIYMQRAMYVLHGLGIVDPSTTYGHPYDHPYFGQLLLAGLLNLFNFPDSLGLSLGSTSETSTGDISNTVNLLHLVPRLLVGTLAVLDTFLIYKIAEHSYNNKTIAFIASILFAVMPITWLMRKLLLESLLLPLLLSSVLFAVYYRKSSGSISGEISVITTPSNQPVLILISGIFLGLAIFTKLPIFTMIPLVGFLIFSRTSRNFRSIALWIVPVILIPLIWPIGAGLNGELDRWIGDLLWQTQRQEGSLSQSLTDLFHIDPVLVILGIAGLVYAAIKRDFLILLWAVPFLVFLFLIGFVSFFYLILLIPIFSVAAARIIADLVNMINNRQGRGILTSTIVLSIAIFGMVSTSLLITTDINSSYLEVYAFVVQQIVHDKDKHNDGDINFDEKAEITLLGNMWTRGYYWIPKYVFGKDADIILLPSSRSAPPTIYAEKILLKLDNHILRPSDSNDSELGEYLKWIKTLNSSTYKIAEFREESHVFENYSGYPYSGSASHNRGIATTEFRVNA